MYLPDVDNLPIRVIYLYINKNYFELLLFQQRLSQWQHRLEAISPIVKIGTGLS